MGIRIKRIYEAAVPEDGLRILIDRLWPRGISKEKAALHRWAKELSPSHELRKWYQHDHDKWPEFKQRYAVELEDQIEALDELRTLAKQETVTLVFSSREALLNNAQALKEMIDE